MTPEELKRLDELENAATPSPWGWKPTGEKSNDAVLATFYSNDGTPIGGRVETERFHEETEKWETLATDDEVIFYKENDANYTDFDFVCAIRNSIRPLLDHIATLEGKAAEVERLSAMVYDTAPGEFSPDGWTWKQAFTSEKARRVEAEAAIENLHEKYAQERIFRSRQTLSDNTKMENQ